MKVLAGRRVRHKATGQTAYIEYKYQGINGVRLDRIVAGFYSWNLEDLQVLPSRKRGKEK